MGTMKELNLVNVVVNSKSFASAGMADRTVCSLIPLQSPPDKQTMTIACLMTVSEGAYFQCNNSRSSVNNTWTGRITNMSPGLSTA